MRRSLLIGLVFSCAVHAQVQPDEDAAPFVQTHPPEVDVTRPFVEGQDDGQTASDEGAEAPAPNGPLPTGRGTDTLLDAVSAELDGTAQTNTGEGETAQQSAGRAMGAVYYLRVFSVLCLVVALIVFFGYFARRVGSRTPLLAGASLGEILGRVYLTKGVTLHYVRTGGRVLVVGSTGNNVSLVAEFDAAAFEPAPAADAASTGPPRQPEDFLAHLRASSRDMNRAGEQEHSDDEIASLRGDIQRLQRYIQEETRGQGG